MWRLAHIVLLCVLVASCGGRIAVEGDSVEGQLPGVTVVARVVVADCKQLGELYGVCNTSSELEASASIVKWNEEYGWVPIFGTVLAADGTPTRGKGSAQGFVLWMEGEVLVVGIEEPMTMEILQGDGGRDIWPDFSKPGNVPAG